MKFWESKPGVYIWDMGQNMVGWCRLNVAGPAGARIVLRHAETLNVDGKLYVDNLRSAEATDTYILKGARPEEVWEPRFTYHGFRYVEMTGYPGKPLLSALEGRVVHDAMEKTADFTSSSSLLNQLHHNIYWGVRGNYRSIPTDCPQRDERQGWMGDRSVVSWGETYLFDVAAFYSKWTQDIEDSQRPTGSIPDVVPNYWVLYNDGITWPSTFLLASNMIYRQYGDARVIEKHYPALRQWVKYMETFLKNDLMPKNTYGDWCVPPESPELIHSKDPARVTDPTLISTAYFYRVLEIMSEDAGIAGKAADAAEYDALAVRVKAAFIERFFKPDTNQFDNGTQTSSVLPLAFGLVPDDRRDQVMARLVKKIDVESNDHVGVGLIGAQWLMRTLTENGQGDLAFKIATQTTYPGWGYMISKGATTVWELWNGDTADPSMNSGNHVMQIGDLNVWFYEYLAGIRFGRAGRWVQEDRHPARTRPRDWIQSARHTRALMGGLRVSGSGRGGGDATRRGDSAGPHWRRSMFRARNAKESGGATKIDRVDGGSSDRLLAGGTESALVHVGIARFGQRRIGHPCHARGTDQIQQQHALVHFAEEEVVELWIARHCPEYRSRHLQYGRRLFGEHAGGARQIGQGGDFAEEVAGVVEVQNAVGVAIGCPDCHGTSVQYKIPPYWFAHPGAQSPCLAPHRRPVYVLPGACRWRPVQCAIRRQLHA